MSGDLLSVAVARYEKEFASKPSTATFAPGRVNLIGEHTDYNDGFVLPFALPFRTVVVGSIVSGGEASRVVSCNIDGPDSSCIFKVDRHLSKGSPSWANYVKGTIKQYMDDLPSGFAFNAVVISDVPIGSGLSSSASLEVGIATFIEKLANITNVSTVDKALRCQKAEHTFADTPCGIMDQFISANGKEGSLLLLDCRTNTFELVSFGKGKNAPVIVVCNSNVKHELSGSEYPDRVKQCKEAVNALKGEHPGVQALRDATMEQLMALQSKSRADSMDSENGSSDGGKKAGGKHISKRKLKQQRAKAKANGGSCALSAVAFMRARHCIGEDQRTLDAVKAMGTEDWASLGKLMTASHRSLQHDYEVSCSELDFLVDSALTVPGVLGSRMTGGGFGGCTVTLCKDQATAEMLMEHFRKVYPAGESFSCSPSAGCGTLEVSNAKPLSSSSTSPVIKRPADPALVVSRSDNYVNEDVEHSGNVNTSPSSSGDSWVLPATAVAAVVGIVAFIFMRRK